MKRVQWSLPALLVKHANLQRGRATSYLGRLRSAPHNTDPTSAFGGIIAFNRELDAKPHQAIISRQFVEVIIAPSASEEALKITAAKQNVRVLVCGQWAERVGLDFKRVKWWAAGSGSRFGHGDSR